MTPAQHPITRSKQAGISASAHRALLCRSSTGRRRAAGDGEPVQGDCEAGLDGQHHARAATDQRGRSRPEKPGDSQVLALTVDNTTITGNTAQSYGAGIDNYPPAASTTSAR
jgi:hypothetical protein